MNKSEVCVKLTGKNCKKVLGILEMFGEWVAPGTKGAILSGLINSERYLVNSSGCWMDYMNPDYRITVKLRAFRNILAKEHLKAGEICVFKQEGKEHIYRVDKISDGNYPYVHNEKHNVAICFDNFLRYATEEEKALLEPKQTVGTVDPVNSFTGSIPGKITYTREVWVNHYSDWEFYFHHDEQSAYMSIGRRGEGTTVKATLTYDIPMTKV